MRFAPRLLVVLTFLLSTMGQAQLRPDAPKVYRAIRYAQTGGGSLLLDLYLPPNASSPIPAVLYIHGGDWMFGNRTRPPVLFLLEHGIGVVSIDYRLAPRNRFPAQIQDCRDALVYLRENARRYGIDPQRQGLIGESAGGHLAALLATAPDEKGFVGTRKGTTIPRVQAVCSVSGPMDIEYLGELADMVEEVIGKHPIQQLLGGKVEQKRSLAYLASPIRHITPETPPFLLVYGDQDFVVPPILNRDMYKALRAAGVEAESHEVKGMAHDMLGIWTSEVRQEITSFFRHHLMESSASTRPATRAAVTRSVGQRPM
jgi:acetyl esterase/lipase